MNEMQRLDFADAIADNKQKSIILILFIFLVALGLLYLFTAAATFYYTGTAEFSLSLLLFLIPVAVVLILLDAIPSYYYGDRLVLKATKAYLADEQKHLHLHNTVEGLAIAAGVPKPKVYILPSPEINAFATGRDPDHASIAVTEGAVEKLSRKELEGVLGHELSHVRNYDIRFALLVAVFVGFVAILSHLFLRGLWYGSFSGGGRRDRGGGAGALFLLVGIILAIVAPIAVRLVQLAASRQREYLADSSGVELTRDPSGLAGALEKIKGNPRAMDVSEAASHLFLDDPKSSFADSIFATHPPLEKRIERLRAMGG